MEPALTLKDAAALLGVNYSTVYEHRRDLGFFQIGNQWRVWSDASRRRLDSFRCRASVAESQPA